MILEDPTKWSAMFNINFQEIQHISFCPTRSAPYYILKRIVDYATFVKQFTGIKIRLGEIAIFWSLILKVHESVAETNISRNTRGIYSDD
jgi:hypothetical protein